jgi:hypothetical protein
LAAGNSDVIPRDFLLAAVARQPSAVVHSSLFSTESVKCLKQKHLKDSHQQFRANSMNAPAQCQENVIAAVVTAVKVRLASTAHPT